MNDNQLKELRIELRDLFNFWETRQQDVILSVYLSKVFPEACKYIEKYYGDEYAVLEQEKVAEVCLCFDQDNDITKNYN